MKKLIIIVFILGLLTLPIFGDNKKEVPKYKIPEVTLLISDGIAFIYCIDGFSYIFIVHQNGAALIQMRTIDKDGKETLKKCDCNNI